MEKIIWIGLDVHKESISVAAAEPGREGEIRGLGTISGDLHAVEKLAGRLRRQYEAKLSFCYEAGPCGFVLARRLQQLGHECIVVAPCCTTATTTRARGTGVRHTCATCGSWCCRTRR